MKHRNELGELYQKHFKTGLGVEVGVQYGYFSQEILKNWRGELKCVDSYEGYEPVYKIAIENLGVDRIIRKKSVDASKDFKNNSLDFVFIDAGHTYTEVKEDIEAWFPKVRNGGIVSGHDYVKYTNFGVIEAVDEFVKDKYDLQLTDEEWWEGYNFRSWFFIK